MLVCIPAAKNTGSAIMRFKLGLRSFKIFIACGNVGLATFI